MNNTTYTANENCFLIDGEVYLAKPYSIEKKLVDRYVLVENEVLKCAEINTKTGIGREPEGHPFIYDGALIVTHSTNPLDGVKQLTRDKFVKPKDGSYTSEQLHEVMISMFEMGRISVSGEKDAQYYFTQAVNVVKDYLNTLSLPASLEINEQGEIVNVIW